MINLGYTITVKDAEDMKKFKESAAYGSYLKSIASSPAFKAIMNEHIKNVDVTEDIKTLKTQGKIPDTVNPKALSDLFKQSLQNMAICLVADSVILKELEDVKMEEIISNLNNESEITYLLGKADKKYYEQASKLMEEDKLQENSVSYRGLMNYLKQNNITVKKQKCSNTKTQEVAIKEPATSKKTISLDDNDVQL